MKISALLKISLRYGVVAGILTVVLLVLLFYMGRNPFLISPFLDFRIFLFGVFMFFAMKEFRDYHQEGYFYFWQGLFSGFVVVLAAAAIGALGLWIFGELEPGFLSSYIEGRMAYLKTFPKEDVERIGRDIYERNLKELPSTTIPSLVITHFAQGMIIGFFITTVLSVIVRKTHQNP